MQIVEFWNIHTKVKKKIREPLFCPVMQKLKKNIREPRVIHTDFGMPPPPLQRGWLHEGGGDKARVIRNKFGLHFYVYRETIGNAL